jgi:hypothetical protein
MTTTTNDTQTRSLEAPGATITYDIRPNETSTQTPEWGQGGDPDAFAERLRAVLDSGS